ncbi:MAG: hypothetical protein GQ535_09095 [Rhodobacteraceae bacterium]|nr:hypothetical protein [Paracoccaceae bacterium]
MHSKRVVRYSALATSGVDETRRSAGFPHALTVERRVVGCGSMGLSLLGMALYTPTVTS